MNREIYDAAFAAMKAQKEICTAFDDVGLRFDYGDGIIGTSLENILNHTYTIIRNVMNFQTKTYTKKILISGCPQTVNFDVLYIGECDEEWAITEDDFSDFVHTAVDSVKMQDMFWNAMTNRDEDAKAQFNKIGTFFKIGVSQYLEQGV